MKRRSLVHAAAASALLLAGGAPAQAQVTLGRLFSTPAERATLEATRGGAAALAPNTQGEQPAPGTPGGPPMPPAADAGAGAGAVAASPAAPPALVMTGVLRRSGSRATTVWLNDQPQSGVQSSQPQRGGTATSGVTVTLPSGKKVALKPGQRYDLNEGRVKDVNEP